MWNFQRVKTDLFEIFEDIYVRRCLDKILSNARDNDVAFLVGGDPLSATTHTDLILRAVELNIPYKIVHNASIMNAIGSCGLQVGFISSLDKNEINLV